MHKRASYRTLAWFMLVATLLSLGMVAGFNASGGGYVLETASQSFIGGNASDGAGLDVKLSSEPLIQNWTQSGPFRFALGYIHTLGIGDGSPIISMNNISGMSVDPTTAGSTEVLISFNVTDVDSAINASTVVVNITLGGVQYRYNISDTGGELGTCYNHTQAGVIIINCSVMMEYYDNASNDWRINITVEDVNGNVGRNDTNSLTYNELSSVTLPMEYINFTSLTLGQQNQPAGGTELVLNNTGNDDFDQINITASDLIGVDTPSDSISVSVFVVNFTNEVNGDGLALGLSAQTIAGISDVENLTLAHGHTDILTSYADSYNSDKGNQSLFFWVDVPFGITAQKYNATWNMTFVDLP